MTPSPVPALHAPLLHSNRTSPAMPTSSSMRAGHRNSSERSGTADGSTTPTRLGSPLFSDALMTQRRDQSTHRSGSDHSARQSKTSTPHSMHRGSSVTQHAHSLHPSHNHMQQAHVLRSAVLGSPLPESSRYSGSAHNSARGTPPLAHSHGTPSPLPLTPLETGRTTSRLSSRGGASPGLTVNGSSDALLLSGHRVGTGASTVYTYRRVSPAPMDAVASESVSARASAFHHGSTAAQPVHTSRDTGAALMRLLARAPDFDGMRVQGHTIVPSRPTASIGLPVNVNELEPVTEILAADGQVEETFAIDPW